MSDIVIRAENLGKRYRIGERERYLALRDLLASAVSSPMRRFVSGKSFLSNGNHGSAHHGDENQSSIWALKETSLEIRQGEVVGVIGRNGAGKSTLLKILSRITKPTTGWAEIDGRVGSLLEVGTGFHPELTGSENIYLSGAILGMSKREITRKFDEIVSFAEVEKFIDTPVKHYSSGMYLKLAFSVAAHLEPEILLVDEVLAVGDAAFQKKSLGKMGQVSREGRTILFVSHNMTAIRALCSRAVLVRDGEVASSGTVTDVVDDYLLGVATEGSARDWPDPAAAPGNENVRISYMRVISGEGKPVITIDSGAEIKIGFENFRKNINLGCTVRVTNSEGVLIFVSSYRISSDGDSRCGIHHMKCRIPGHLLNAGRYSVDLIFGKDQRWMLFQIDSVVSFEVKNTATGRGSSMTLAPGVIRPLLSWSHSFEEESSLVNQL
ncbi:MAG TPA: ABC transporter ATP-binding protein [Terriglobales bacterium]|nr:ABC transporter ATP-binding protein [Terriglobales bacterium]